jgi:hypothetical protein
MTFTPTKEIPAIMAENPIQSSEVATYLTELEAYVESGSGDAEDVTYDNATSGLTATDVQAALDELAGSGGAEDVTYDNATSGLTATDVQAALDELAGTGDAEDVTYDNATSGLTATDVQAALDELAGSGGGGVAYVSSEQTITSAGLLTLAHGFGAKPSLIASFLRCKVADAGYSVGDEIEIPTTYWDGATRVSTFYTDGTNIYCRYATNASVFAIGNKASGAAVGIVNTSWRMIVRAWK